MRIYLCLISSNSNGERSISKLKWIKNELRSSLSQQRLNHLSLLSTNSEPLRKQNCCKLIHEFDCKNAREILLKFKCDTMTCWEKLRTFSYSWAYDSTNVFVFTSHTYPFHLMLQSVLFRVMKTSIVGISFLIEKWGPRKIVAQGPWKPHRALRGELLEYFLS